MTYIEWLDRCLLRADSVEKVCGGELNPLRAEGRGNAISPIGSSWNKVAVVEPTPAYLRDIISGRMGANPRCGRFQHYRL